jgi:hypothetical protein
MSRFSVREYSIITLSTGGYILCQWTIFLSGGDYMKSFLEQFEEMMTEVINALFGNM